MILDNHLDVPADPDAVFAFINDVERVAGCLPGAAFDGREGDAYVGRVAITVGPITAAYAGRVRPTEVVADERRLRLSARGADSNGHSDAGADVVVIVTPTPGGSALDLHTDLVIRGKIAQFGKAAIATVSDRLLDEFARNLAAELDTPAATEQLDRPTMLLPANAKWHAAAAGALLLALVQGWLLGRRKSIRRRR